jgi:D-alanyl-D-alanine carboxypeptidase
MKKSKSVSLAILIIFAAMLSTVISCESPPYYNDASEPFMHERLYFLSDDAGIPPDQELLAILEGALNEQDIPALQLSLRQHSEILFSAAIGSSTLRRTDHIDRETMFRIASISKLFTAVLIMDLVEEGLISLEDTLDIWLPDFPRAAEMTVEDLLNHHAGAPEPLTVGRALFTSGLFPRRNWNREELLDILADGERRAAESGTFSYSNGGYILLAVIAEEASGVGFDQLLESRIFSRFQAGSLTVLPLNDDTVPAQLIPGIDRDLMPWRNIHRPEHRSWASLAWSSGALAGSADDLTAFMDALMSGKIIDGKSLERMERYLETGGSIGEWISGYGLGIAEYEIAGRRFICHPGLFIGFQGLLLFEPTTGISIALLGNASSFDAEGILEQLILSDWYRGLQPGSSAEETAGI